MSKKAAPAPKAPTHVCTASCTCRVCQGKTWYIDGKHVCIRAACGARW